VGNFVSRNERMSNQGQVTQIFTNIYVKNFDESTNEDRLRDLFSKFGEITSIKLTKEEASGKALFAFINFNKPESALQALHDMNDKELDNGKRLYVSRFQKKNERVNFIKSKLEEKRQERLKKFAGVNLFVKNLDDKIDDERLGREFSAFGQITSAKVMTEHQRSKGFGFVCYSSPEEAARAVAEMNGRIVGTKPLYVAIAQRKEDRKRILTVQFRERLQNSQYLIQQYFNQGKNIISHRFSHRTEFSFEKKVFFEHN
jgi:polyadenylate-binding protein